MAAPIEIVRITRQRGVDISDTESVWCVEFTQGTTSSYRYVSARDEIEAYKKFWNMEGISRDILKEKNNEQR